jgi:hypothetical protein
MVICEGGDTISENNYVIHSFKTVGVSTLKVIEGGLVEVLVVAGGGGGGNGNSTAMEAGGGGAGALGLDLFYPRSKDHWAAIYDFVVNISGSTIANDIKTVGAVHRNGAGGNYTGIVMRSSIYYITGTTDWRVPDDGKWYIRDTTYGEPNGDYTANAFLGLIGLNSDGSVTGFNDGYDYNYYTGTTIICSTNVKGFSYYN